MRVGLLAPNRVTQGSGKAEPRLYLDMLAQHVHANAPAGGDVMYESSICGSRVQPICKPLAPVSSALGRDEDRCRQAAGVSAPGQKPWSNMPICMHTGCSGLRRLTHKGPTPQADEEVREGSASRIIADQPSEPTMEARAAGAPKGREMGGISSARKQS